MAEFSSHQPGTFSWPELATTDQAAGVAFYRTLFGWDLNEQSMGPDGTYSMFLMRGKEVAAAYSMRCRLRRIQPEHPQWKNTAAYRKTKPRRRSTALVRIRMPTPGPSTRRPRL